MFLNVYEINFWSVRLELKTVIIHKKYKITQEILKNIAYSIVMKLLINITVCMSVAALHD